MDRNREGTRFETLKDESVVQIDLHKSELPQKQEIEKFRAFLEGNLRSVQQTRISNGELFSPENPIEMVRVISGLLQEKRKNRLANTLTAATPYEGNWPQVIQMNQSSSDMPNNIASLDDYRNRTMEEAA